MSERKKIDFNYLATSRAEHLRWAKDRALECADRDDFQGAIESLISDLSKHPELADSAQIASLLGAGQLLIGGLNNVHDMSVFIEGFN